MRSSAADVRALGTGDRMSQHLAGRVKRSERLSAGALGALKKNAHNNSLLIWPDWFLSSFAKYVHVLLYRLCLLIPCTVKYATFYTALFVAVSRIFFGGQLVPSL